AEAVRHDDDSSAQRRPEPATARPQHASQAERLCPLALADVAGEPGDVQRGIALCSMQCESERALAEAGPAREHPGARPPRNDQGRQAAERVERSREKLRRVTPGKSEAGHERCAPSEFIGHAGWPAIPSLAAAPPREPVRRPCLVHVERARSNGWFNRRVGLSKDIRTANRVLRKLMRSRSARSELARRAPELPRPAAGSIQIAVYFADATVNMYQIRQWYAPLAELAAEHPVAIISRSPSAALKLLEESPVPVVYRRSIADLEGFIAEQDLKIVFYVNQNSKNFQMMRYGRIWHVFINHGESDKMYMTTNQFKAYDYSLITGEAARERLSRKLWNFDVDRRTIMIGRPQADHFAGALPYTPDARTVVLYAPTWEGDRDAAAYGSVVSHGEALAAAVLASPDHRLIYRPHPRTGVLDPEVKRANE